MISQVNGVMIAMTFKDLHKPGASQYTHLEIHPSLAFGVLTSTIPAADHNQG